jgi:hypothetical protein
VSSSFVRSIGFVVVVFVGVEGGAEDEVDEVDGVEGVAGDAGEVGVEGVDGVEGVAGDAGEVGVLGVLLEHAVHTELILQYPVGQVDSH